MWQQYVFILYCAAQVCSSVPMLMIQTTGTYHILHVGGRGVHLPPEFVVKVENELCVAVCYGPLASLLGLPPVALLIRVLVQHLLQA